MIALLTLGATLSLDNFRISIVLGGLKPTLRQSVKTSFIFGVWDGAPLVGIIIGHFLRERIDATAELMRRPASPRTACSSSSERWCHPNTRIRTCNGRGADCPCR